VQDFDPRIVGKRSIGRKYADAVVPERPVAAGDPGPTEEFVALILVVFVAVGEALKSKDDPEKWLLDTFARCLAAVQLEDVVLEPR
jgi:hypothetical protein